MVNEPDLQPMPQRRVIGLLLLLLNVSLAVCGLSGTYLSLTVLDETEEYSLFDVWWADDAADILKRFGIDRIYHGLTIARTGAILACITCCSSLIVAVIKILFQPDFPGMSLKLLASLILSY